MIPNVGNPGEDLNNSSESQGDHQRADLIPVWNASELRDAQGQGGDGESEQSDRKDVDLPSGLLVPGHGRLPVDST